MFLGYFTEQPMSVYPEEAVGEDRVTVLTFSNKYFDPVEGSRLYSEYLEHYLMVEEAGFDGIMLNEHHTAPFCMQPRINIFASILAGMTKKAKLVLLGNPLPIWDNPVHLAEELAMIDMISKGRLVSGFVRGAGQESIQANANPVYNRELFAEAHDLVIKAWTTPGPFRWEGNHYQFRVINPWAVPLQKPYPRVWIPGLVSRETVVWAAEHRYPYIGLNTNFELGAKIKNIYGEAAERVGYTPGTENFGQLLGCHVQDTAERAYRNARGFMWMRGEFTGVTHPVWTTPSGYGSPSNRRALIEIAAGRRTHANRELRTPTFEERINDLTFMFGTPDEVIKKARVVMERNRPGIMILHANDGKVSHQDAKRCIQLIGQEVLPALREYADELEIKSPYEVNSPVSLEATPAGELHPTGVAAPPLWKRF